MEEKILLRLRYIHREYVEIEVDDPDKCNIMDLFVDLLEGAEKTGMFLPDHPTLWYAHNGQSCQLESDIDVVNMFHLFSDKKLITLSIGSADFPSQNLELARGLFKSKRPAENSLHPKSSHGSQSTSRRKIPATSARRRGIYIPKGGSTSRSVGSEPTSGELSRTMGDVNASILPVADIPTVDISDVDLHAADLLGDLPVDDDGLSNSDSEYFDRIYENGEMYVENEYGEIKLKVWMLFADKESLMNVVRDHCIQKGFAIVVGNSDLGRYTAVCGAEGCGWRIHASTLSDKVTWAIKSLNDTHNCIKLRVHNPMATSAWAATKILDDVRADEDVKGQTIQNHLFKRYGINLKPTSLYKARALALEIIKGSADTSYGSVPGYCEVLKMSNPGSKAHVVWRHGDEDPEKPIQFKSVFISLKPMIEGFIHGCRGLIGVDGCHLKGKYGGVVLSAIALDGNNEIFPIAYGVYENESKRTWSSFFYHLREILSNANRDNLCIVSDRQKVNNV